MFLARKLPPPGVVWLPLPVAFVLRASSHTPYEYVLRRAVNAKIPQVSRVLSVGVQVYLILVPKGAETLKQK